MSLDGFLRVNQTTYAWSSSIVKLDGFGIEGVLSLDFEEKREIPQVYAGRQDGRPVAWAGGGKYSVVNPKMKVLADTWLLMQAYLAGGGSLSPGLGSYGDAQFALSLQLTDPNVPIVSTIVAAPARIIGVKEAREEGANMIVNELELSVLQIVRNGIPLWSVVRQIASDTI